jgi:hypothetical protein
MAMPAPRARVTVSATCGSLTASKHSGPAGDCGADFSKQGEVMPLLNPKAKAYDLRGLQSEHHNCIDCGYNTHPGAPTRQMAEFLMARDGTVPLSWTEETEVYMVHNYVWKAAGMEPYGGCLCIGCLENRIGRKLKPKDFPRDHAFNNSGLPCTERLRQRRGQ